MTSPVESPPQPLCVSADPCPGCGYRRTVIVAKDESSARFRQHDMRQPSLRGEALTKLGVCPGSGREVRIWSPLP